MEKVDKEFIKDGFNKDAYNYKKAVEEIGLWKSEREIFKKYLDKEDYILDIGCGAGRTTFGLYAMGYKNIVGLDITPRMIEEAKNIKKKREYKIAFVEGDATDLDMGDNFFEKVIFSFNGLMQIPKRENRLKAMEEIYRVLKPGGIFIFTTHDRDRVEEYKQFWIDEKKKWENGEQDERVHEFGDIIVSTENNREETFIHIPDRDEVIRCLKQVGFSLVEDIFRGDFVDENDRVKKFSTDCRFWIAKKGEL